MYADDTTLYCCLEDIASEDKAHTLNIESERVHSLLNANRLTLNVNKTNCFVSVEIITPANYFCDLTIMTFSLSLNLSSQT